MFWGINSIYTPVYLPLCEYGQNQPPCADVGLLLNMARTCSFHSLVWAILRSNPPSLHVGWFFKIYPSGALGVYFPIYTPRSIYRSVYLIVLSNYEDKRPAFTPDYTRSLWRLPAENKTPARLPAWHNWSENLAHPTSNQLQTRLKLEQKHQKCFKISSSEWLKFNEIRGIQQISSKILLFIRSDL